MKKIISFVVLMVLISFSLPAFAQQEMNKVASDQAYEHASDKAIFNRVSDWFVTVGKSKEEKATILAERKTERAAKRAEKEVQKAQKAPKKEAKKAQKDLEDTGRKVKEKTGKVGKDVEGFMKKQGQGRNQ